MSKCFLLGAGASYGYSDAKEGVLSPPMGGELFSRGEQLGLLNHGKFPNLDRVYSNYVDKYGRDNLDVEDVMIKSFSDDSRWPAGELMYYIYELFRFYALDYDHFIHTDNYQKLAELFYTEEYDVISINYDTLFEQALSTKGLSVEYNLYSDTVNKPKDSKEFRGSSEDDQEEPYINMAKIHGSINWENPIAIPHIIRKQRNIESKEHLMSLITHMYAGSFHKNIADGIPTELRPFGLERVQRQSYLELLLVGEYVSQTGIIPPVGSEKKYDHFAELKSVHESAKQMLQDASELVVIGSRLREQDGMLHRLIGENLDPNAEITLVVGHDSDTYDEITDNIRNNAEDFISDKRGYKISRTRQYFGEYMDDIT